MATSYGIGQYRFDKRYKYIDLLREFDKDKNEIGSNNQTINWLDYYKTTDNFQDIVLALPSYNGTPLVQYGKTFFLELTIPQSRDYKLILNLKLCDGDPNQPNSIVTSRYQHIKQLVIPPAPIDNSGVMSPTLLFEDPTQEGLIRAQVIDEAHDETLWNETLAHKENEVYRTQSGFYLYKNNEPIQIDKNAYYTLEQTWKKRDSTSEALVTVKFAFSPKYNLSTGYSYLLIETDRSDSYQRTIQYIEKSETYYGTRLTKDYIKAKLYQVSNLLERGSNGQSQIQSATDSLTHISIWGHPEQILTINGEEIKIGQSGFYELKDFTINNLGVIVEDPDVDRFIIDYEYKIITSG